MGLRVALLHPCFWPEVRRGSERYVHDLARGLQAAGHEPTVLTAHPGRPGRGSEGGVPVLRQHRPPDGWLRRRGFDDFWTHVPAQYVALARGGYDVAHAFFPTDGVAAGAWARRNGRASVFSMMGVPNPGLRIRHDALPRAARGCDAFTVDSHAVARDVQAHYGLASEVVYPGVDLHAFTPGGARHPEPTAFCPASIDVARKRVELLLAAADELRRRGTPLRVVTLAPADPRRAAALLAAHPGLEFFPPTHDPAALAALYREAWVTVLPSHGEAFGMVVTESLACGTPVVAGPIDAFPEILDSPRVGRLADPTDAAALATAIADAAGGADPVACRERAHAFGAEATVAAFLALYARLTAPG